MTKIKEAWAVEYTKLKDEADVYYVATFDDQDGALLFWDTIYYLRNEYKIQSSRPQ